MKLSEFIEEYDKEGAIVLLEGKRNFPVSDQSKLTAFGELLCTVSKHIVFRSGNADGADYYFSLGVSAVDKNRLQVIAPYANHRAKSNLAGYTLNIDEINLLEEPNLVQQSFVDNKNQKIIKNYASGLRQGFNRNAAYLIRDTAKVIGAGPFKAADFAFFYDDLEKPMSGGTGHTMKVCIANNVPLLTQEVWIHWF